jgi:hypothetical protein
MKRTSVLLACLAMAAGPLAGAVSGQIDLVSRYIWRGFDLLPDNHMAIQPSFTVDLGESGIALNVWSSFALANRGDFKYCDEIDLTLSYDVAMPEGWELSAGFILYGYWFAEDFRFKDSTSPEVFASLTRTDLPLSPQLCVYYDFNLGSGLYVTLGGGHEWKLSEKTSVEAGALIGFNSRQYIDRTGFSDIDIFVKAPLVLGRATLTPSLSVMVPLMDEVNEDTEIWFGFTAAI